MLDRQNYETLYGVIPGVGELSSEQYEDVMFAVHEFRAFAAELAFMSHRGGYPLVDQQFVIDGFVTYQATLGALAPSLPMNVLTVIPFLRKPAE